MQANQKGIALLAIMFFMVLISLFLMDINQEAFLQPRLNHVLQQQTQQRVLWPSIEKKIQQRLQRGRVLCEMPLSNVNDFLAHDFPGHACSGEIEELQYRYVVSLMPKTPCLRDQGQPLQLYRVIILVGKANPSVYQSVMAVKSDERLACARPAEITGLVVGVGM